MIIQNLIDTYLNDESCRQNATEFAKENLVQNEEVPVDIAKFLGRFARGEAFIENEYTAFYSKLQEIENIKIRNVALNILNEIAMEIYERYEIEIQYFASQIENQLIKGLPLSFARENCIEKYQALLNIYCLLRNKKDPYDADSHFTRFQSSLALRREVPFMINTLTLMNRLPKEGNYCGIKMGEPIYPILMDRETKKEIPLNKRGIKDHKSYFPFKQVSKIEKGDTGDNTFLATNGKKLLYVRGSVDYGRIYTKDRKTQKLIVHSTNSLIYYSSQAVLASKIATFVSHEHFSSERILNNGFAASKKQRNYGISYAKGDVRDEFKNNCDTNPGAGIVDEVLNFVREEDPNIENFGFSTNRVDEAHKSVVCKIDFDHCDLVNPISKTEYEKDVFTRAITGHHFKKTTSYYDEKLYSRLKLAVMSEEFIRALTEKAYPEAPSQTKEKDEIDVRELVISEVMNRIELAFTLFLENSETKNFLQNNRDVFNRLLKEGIEYIQAHFEKSAQEKLIKSIEQRIQFVNKKVQNKFKEVELISLVNANSFINQTKKPEFSKQVSAFTNNSSVGSNKPIITPHKRTTEFIRDVEKEIRRIEGTLYGDPKLKQNKLAVLRFLQDCAKKKLIRKIFRK